ncbi:hypothetical protein RN001_005716 [Aquatica leii]|uniref:PPIase cyclophilin-type domain-containing protein n=1 Tax=Aquatica leii TaxID=1421715 RepID=A0AAN7Q1N6_9COLE|nr:hypothetical protein RN001_005716 [Aquatica leii]
MENVCSTPTEKSRKTQDVSKKSPQKTKFRPFQIPRYLPGQVRKTKLMQDLKDYNKHRYQVFTAAPRIDARPPLMNPNKYNNAQRLISNRYRVDEIQRQNKDIIKKINTINRKGGWVDSFNPHAYDFKSNWRSHQLKMREIKSDYAFKDTEKFWNHVVAELKYYTRFPLIILDKIPLDTLVRQQPSISDGEFVDRPKCFMDFRVKDGVYLGRIVIELYHDYVPVTVQNFMSICCDQDGLSYKNCQVHRVFPGLYIEAGDITKGNGKGGASIYGETFVEENHMLKHSRMGKNKICRSSKKHVDVTSCLTEI